jgi:hypothetical protein
VQQFSFLFAQLHIFTFIAFWALVLLLCIFRRILNGGFFFDSLLVLGQPLLMHIFSLFFDLFFHLFQLFLLFRRLLSIFFCIFIFLAFFSNFIENLIIKRWLFKFVVVDGFFEQFVVPRSYLTVQPSQHLQCFYHFFSFIVSGCGKNAFLAFVLEVEVESSILDKQCETAVGVPDSAEMETGAAFCCLMVDETKVLIGIDEVALPQKVLKTLGSLEPTAKMQRGPQQSFF